MDLEHSKVVRLRKFIVKSNEKSTNLDKYYKWFCENDVKEGNGVVLEYVSPDKSYIFTFQPNYLCVAVSAVKTQVNCELRRSYRRPI